MKLYKWDKHSWECETAKEQLPNGNKEEIEAKYEQLMDGAASYGDYLANQEGGD